MSCKYSSSSQGDLQQPKRAKGETHEMGMYHDVPCLMPGEQTWCLVYTLLGTNISPPKARLKMIFPFPTVGAKMEGNVQEPSVKQMIILR